MSAQKSASSGIQTFADGQAYIPSSKRADGSTRKEIKVRPGYKPPEDIEKYKSRTAETWRSRGGGVPGTEVASSREEPGENKGKNAKRREAARRKKEAEDADSANDVNTGVANLSVQASENHEDPHIVHTGISHANELDAERQKKIRNQLKKLKAVRELKAKKSTGEKLSADQLVKISKELEIVRDLVKLEYEGPEIQDEESSKELQTGG